jgi:hypothetical protein
MGGGVCPSRVLSQTTLTNKKTLAIYLFFEEVDSPANGVAVEGSQYFKCWLGNRVIIEIPSTARYNVSSESVLVHCILCIIFYTLQNLKAISKQHRKPTIVYIKSSMLSLVLSRRPTSSMDLHRVP